MPRLTRVKPVGIALTLYEVWRRLPPRQRAMLFAFARRHGVEMARRHGPRVAVTIARRRAPRP